MTTTIRSFPYSWYIIRSVIRVTRRVPLVEQKLVTVLEYRSSPPSFSGIRVARFLVTVWCFVYYCLSFCPFSFDHCIVVSDLRLLTSKNTWISIPWFTASYYHFCILKVSTNIVNTILSVTCDDITEILLKVAFNTLAFPFPTLFNVNENKLIHEMKTNQTNRFTIHLFHFPRKQTFKSMMT
jgi:hypothetical protein